MDKQIRVTKKLLDTHKKRVAKIPVLEWELAEMQKGDNGFDNSVIKDYRTGQARPQSVVGFDWDLYCHRKTVLEREKEKVKAVEQWIDDIEEGQTRCVFKMFYIDGMSWLKIADKIKATGDHREDYPRICIRDVYLKKIGMK